MNKRTGKWTALIGILLCLVAALAFLTMGKSSGPEVQTEFTQMTEGKITPDKLMEARRYLDKNIKKLDSEYASHLLVSYEDYALRFINTEADDTLVQQFSVGYDSSGTIEEEKLVSQELLELYKALNTADIDIIQVEDRMMLELDYSSLKKSYGAYICQALNGLYDLKALEQKDPCIENATLLVSWGELARRAHEAELLIDRYGDEHLITEDIRWMFETYSNFMLMGANNTPVFDYETTEFKPEAKVQYDRFIEENPKCVVSWMLQEYFRYLQENEYKMNYKDSEASKEFFNTCSWLVTEGEKRVYQ